MARSGIWTTIIVGGMITIATGLGAWNLNKTASIPENYATKTEVSEVKKDAKEDRDRIRQDIKDGFKGVQTEQRELRHAIQDLNSFLRDKFHE